MTATNAKTRFQTPSSSKLEPIGVQLLMDHPERYSDIPGSAPEKVKQTISTYMKLIVGPGHRFGDNIGHRLRIVTLDHGPKADEPKKMEARVVTEVDVTEEMLNSREHMHGGCSAYLVDVCATLPILVHSFASQGPGQHSVSQVINMVYHSPAGLGDRLRIVASTIAGGSRAQTSRCDIWNETHHRLVASGVHIKMDPVPKL